MNTDHLRYLCSIITSVRRPAPQPRFPAGFITKCGGSRRRGGPTPSKELSPDADLSDEDTAKGYNVSEAIAETFASVGIAAVAALKAGDDYLTIVGDRGYLVYPWCNYTALPSGQVDERHGLDVARLLARMHGANIYVTGVKEATLDQLGRLPKDLPPPSRAASAVSAST